MIKQLNKKKIMSLNLFLAVLVIGLCAVLFFLHINISKNIESASESLEKFNQSISLKQFSEKELISSIEKRKSVIEYFDGLIVDGYNIVDLFSYLEELATESNVSISISGVKTSKDYSSDKISDNKKTDAEKTDAGKADVEKVDVGKADVEGTDDENVAETNSEISNELGLISMETKITGPEAGVVKFLKLFENSPFVFETSAVDLKRIKNNWELDLKFELISN